MIFLEVIYNNISVGIDLLSRYKVSGSKSISSFQTTVPLNVFTLLQKDSPVRAGLCTVPEEYHYSSARFYYDGTNSFGMLKHYSGN
jgi:hypothetical protein